MLGGDARQGRAGIGNEVVRRRKPGEERDPALAADVQDVVVYTVKDVVAILDRGDRSDSLTAGELSHADVAQPDVGDLSVIPKLDQRAERFFDRDVGIDRVELVQRNSVEPQTPQASLARLDQVIGVAVRSPPVFAESDPPSFGGDDNVIGIRVERLGDQQLARLWSVAVGRVNELDSAADARRTMLRAASRSGGGP